jgi:hypothetical protein
MVTILCSDMVGSTDLYAGGGDVAAHQLMAGAPK